MSDSLWLQIARLPCPSPSPRVCSTSCPLSCWWHPTISSFVTPFSSCPQSFSASGSFPMSWLFTGGQSIGASALASVLPMNIQGWLTFRIDCFDLLEVQGTLKSLLQFSSDLDVSLNLLQHPNLRASILPRSTFFMVQLSQLYMTTGKTIALILWIFVGKVIDISAF